VLDEDKAWEGLEMHTFYLEKLKGRDHLGDPGIDGRIILKCILSRM
jgi:hypothetical protein